MRVGIVERPAGAELGVELSGDAMTSCNSVGDPVVEMVGDESPLRGDEGEGITDPLVIVALTP